MKKTLLLLIALIVSFGLYAQTTAIKSTQGDGSKLNPYQIENLANLRWLSETSWVWDRHFIQTADIDATETASWNNGAGFSPIGNGIEFFTGSYNGNYHKIIALTINAPSTSYMGFLGETENASIEKLILENCNIKGKNNVGGIVGHSYDTKVYQCSVTGTVEGVMHVGGLIGYSSSAEVEESFSNATVIGNEVVGGIIGMSASSTYIENCYSLSLISSSGANSGGLVGEQNGTTVPRFINNYFAGTFGGMGNYKGGILGRGIAPKTDIGNFWDSQKTGIADNVGKAVAKNSVEMNSVNTFLDAGWHFKLKNSENNKVWNIGNDRNDSYPYLDWQYPNDDGLDIPLLPIVRATKIETISQGNVKVTLEVDYVGNSIATQFGVCYALNSNPTISDNKVISSSSISDGEFIISISGLAKDKLYFLKAYAINNVGTAYSNEISYIDLSVQVPSGAGTVENPYLISNFEELLWISNNSDSWEKHFVQTADIDASLSIGVNDNQGFIPIGGTSVFRGSYDGNYHKITNLTINRPETNFVGLFGYISNATIKKLVVENINIKGNSHVGGIAGYSYTSTIYQTSTSGLVEGDRRVGGITGTSYTSLIEESSSNVTLLANDYVGGLIGSIDGSTINNCYSLSSISSFLHSFSGGLIGYGSFDKSKLTNNYFAGTFFGGPFDGLGNYAGGIFGFGNTPSIDKGNFWDREKSGVTRNIGLAEDKNTAEMTDLNTFVDAEWVFKVKNAVDFGVWNIGNGRNNGYPYLNWQYFDDEVIDIDKAPVVKTGKVEIISETEAEVTFTVVYVGNPLSTEFGICYGLDENLTVDDNKVISSEEINEGEFTITISGLETYNLYHFKAYAINDIDTTYGEEIAHAIVLEQMPTGEGTVEEPYLISNFAELLWLSKNSESWDKHFIQTANIDASISAHINNGTGLSPIGNETIEFTGSYNGNYHNINDLIINHSEIDYIGLFGYSNNAIIQKLVLENLNLIGKHYVGGIVGYASNSTIYQTSVTGLISGNRYIGGIIGYSSYSIIEESFSGSTISGNDYVGGIAGRIENTTIINNCYSVSLVPALNSSYSGGIIGYNFSSSTKITNNYFAGTFNGTSSDKGGIIGYGNVPTIDVGNFWDSEKSGVTHNTGIAEGKTTAEMTDLNTFLDNGWEFNLKNSVDLGAWNIGNGRNSGYPYLSWQYPDDERVDVELPPIVKTVKLETISETELLVTLAVDYIGNPIATEFGVCFGLDENPTIDDNKAISSEEIKEGEFTITISDIEVNKMSYFKAYAINEVDIAYGEEIAHAIVLDQTPTGEGTEEEPYLISNFAELLWVSNNSESWDKHLVQTADIDASISAGINDRAGFSPIGNVDIRFRGSYNGNYHKIENLTINRPDTNYIGLFGYAINAKIEKLIIENSNIEGKERVGGIVGYASNGTIYQTSVTGSISGNRYIGGIIGYTSAPNIQEVFSDAVIFATSRDVGGLVGYIQFNGLIKNSYSVSSILCGGTNVGGLVGYNGNSSIDSKFLNNYFAGDFGSISGFKGGIIHSGKTPEIDVANFWDSEKSGVTRNTGIAESKTTAEMTDLNTFVDAEWEFKFKNAVDFGVWNIGNGRNDGYPYLNWQYPDDEGIDIEKAPVVKTGKVEIISETEVEVTFTVDYVGNPLSTEFGVCYDLDENPNVDDNKAISSDEISEGEFTITISDLEVNKLYYFKAYAINDVDITYGEEIAYAIITDQTPTGEGTKEEPYLISNFAELLWISNNSENWEKHFIQTADIDASLSASDNDGNGFSPIGNETIKFTGSYNGNYHKIENLTINRPETNYIGLFGYTNDATIEKTVLENLNLTGKNHVGGIVGYASNSTIYQTSVTGSISGYRYIGGIAGYHSSGTIKESFSDADIYTRYEDNGGIVGQVSNGTIENCYSLSIIHTFGSSSSGGIVGANSLSSIIKNNYFAGVFTGTSSYKGGVIGVGSSLITDVGNFWDREKSGVTRNVGSAESKTTAEMTNINTFVDGKWKFKLKNSTNHSVWNIGNGRNDGYPYLNWQYPDDKLVDIELVSIVKTEKVEIISQTELQVNVTVDYVGNPIATEFGICYGLNDNPTVEDKKVISLEEISEGELSLIITDFEDEKTYYFRAYAINEEGISYGSVISKLIIISEFAEEPLNGDGSEANPYEIATLANLKWLSDNSDVWDKHFIQTADIDAEKTTRWNDSKGFSSIGNSTIKFTGSYNGNFYKIENLTINRSETDYQGLFGYIDNANIENLQLENVNIKGKARVAGIAGHAHNSTINKTSVTGSLSGYRYIGGIVGYNNDSVIKESYSSADIYTSYEDNGGIVGHNNNGIIENCYSLSVIHSYGSSSSGGIIGSNSSSDSVVKNNYFAGTFSGESNFKGGVIGYGNSPKTYVGNFWDSELSDVTRNVGSAQGKTTTEMTDVDTFLDAEWSFKLINEVESGIWNIGNERNNGYPYLNWQYPSDDGVDIKEEAVIKTVRIDQISKTELQVYFTVENVGNPIATEFGICYGLNDNPTIDDNKVASLDEISEGEFSLITAELNDDNRYYFRAYAKNSEEIFYGNVIDFYLPVDDDPNGSIERPFEISTLDDLKWLSENSQYWDKHFIQTADIDASETQNWNDGKGFSPIGNNITNFTGSYNGNYHTIENLYINNPNEDYQGLFGSVVNIAVVENLILKDVTIEGSNRVGGIAGFNNGTISQTFVTGSIKGYDNIGGISGYNSGGIIEKSFSDATLHAEYNNSSVGGIAGTNYDGTIKNCYSKSLLSANGTSTLGGIMGYNWFGNILNNYFAGTFEGNSTKNGISGIGRIYDTESSNFWDKEVTGVDKNSEQAKTTAEMKDIDTFLDADWDFGDRANVGIWSINSGKNDGYPYLSWMSDIVSVNIKSVITDSNILVTPNPFSDVVNITGSGINRVKVYTISGIQMLDTKYNNESEITIPTSELDKGVYLFIIENNSNVETYRLIKR